MYCPQCGSKLPDEALFCSECGSAVKPDSEKQPEPASKTKKGGSFAWILVIVLVVVLGGVFVDMNFLGGKMTNGLFKKDGNTGDNHITSEDKKNVDTKGDGDIKVKDEVIAVDDKSNNNIEKRVNGNDRVESGNNGTDIKNNNDGIENRDNQGLQKELSGQDNHVTDGSLGQEGMKDEIKGGSEGGLGNAASEPTFEEFADMEQLEKTGFPIHYNMLDIFNIYGEWKYEIIFNDDLHYKEIGRITIDAGQHTNLVELYPTRGTNGGESYKLNKPTSDYNTFKGQIEEGILFVADGNMTIAIASLAESNGVKYAYGTIVHGDSGSIGLILLRK